MSTATLRLHPPRRSVWAHLQNLSVARKIGMVFLGLLLSSALVAVALLWQLQRVNQEVAQATAHSEQRMLWAVRWRA
jgi:CHASE3 domain sensor protein